MTDRHSLESLFDFKDLTTKTIVTERQKFEQTTSQSSQNEDIIRSFKELREKLKCCQKENFNCQEEIRRLNVRLKQAEETLTGVTSNNLKLKDQLSRSEEINGELKKRLHQMKEELIKYQTLDEELSFTKQVLLQLKCKEKSLLEENKKKTQLFLEEKMELEQQISKLKAKTKSNEDFISKLQAESSKHNQTNIKLENTMRKMSISYEQQQFTQKWSKENFQTENLQTTILQLQKQIQLLKSKLEIEKEKRYNVEDQMIQLQEKAGLDNIKVETFSGQTELLMKKEKKLFKKIDNLQNKLTQSNEEKIRLEETVEKYNVICEELLCQIKNATPMRFQEYSRKVKAISKEPKSSPLVSHNQKSPINESRDESLIKNTSLLNNHKRYQSNPQIEIDKFQKKYTFGDQKQNNDSQLEQRIRRERQQMERRLKEKVLQSKLQCSMPNEVYRLRSEYINSLRFL